MVVAKMPVTRAPASTPKQKERKEGEEKDVAAVEEAGANDDEARDGPMDDDGVGMGSAAGERRSRGLSLDVWLGPQGEMSEAAAARRFSIAIDPCNGHGHDHRRDSAGDAPDTFTPALVRREMVGRRSREKRSSGGWAGGHAASPLTLQSFESQLSSRTTGPSSRASKASASPEPERQPKPLGQLGRLVIGRLAEAGLSAVSRLEAELPPIDAEPFVARKRARAPGAERPPTPGAAPPRRGLLVSVTPPRRDSLRDSASSDDDELRCVRALLTPR